VVVERSAAPSNHLGLNDLLAALIVVVAAAAGAVAALLLEGGLASPLSAGQSGFGVVGSCEIISARLAVSGGLLATHSKQAALLARARSF
jgi:hypothetical protein